MSLREIQMNKPLKVLMMSHLRRRGTFARSHAMARQLVDRGHKVTLIVTANTRKLGIRETEWDGVQVVESPDLLWGRLRSGWDLWNLLNRLLYLSRDQGPYDLIHCFETRPATIYPALFYRKQHKLPLVTDWNDWWGRGGIINELRPKWYQIMFGAIETYYEEAFRTKADGLTAISSALVKRARGLGVPAERILHISGGAFLDQFPARPIEECRVHAGLDPADPILAYSSMNAHVELDFMLQTLAVVARKYPRVKLLMTGRTSPVVAHLARAHGVEDNLYLTGLLPFEELPWYLGCANAFLLPFPDKIYNVGRWPNKIGDYLCLGRPLVSNPVGDVKLLLETNDVGLLAQWDVEDFAQRIIYLIENPDVAAQLGQNARTLALTTYDWKILGGKLEAFYHSVLARQQAECEGRRDESARRQTAVS